MRRPDTTVVLVFLFVVLLGGANFVAVRFSNREVPPFVGAALRFALGSVLLLALTRAMHLSLPRGRALWGTLAFGVVDFGLFYGFVYWSLQSAPAAVAATLVALAPLLTFLGAVAIGDERFHWRGLVGGVIAVAGVAVIFAEQIRDVPTGALVALALQPVAFAVGTIMAKRLPPSHPVATNAVAMAPGAALLLALAVIVGETVRLPQRAETWIALAYLLAGTPILFVAFFFVVRRWTASATSYAAVLFPVVTLPLGALLASEAVSGSFLVGAALVIIGVYVGALAPMAASAEAAPGAAG